MHRALILHTCLVMFAASIGCEGDSFGTPDADGGSTVGALFTEANDRLGIQFVHDAGPAGRYLMPEMIPPGVAVFDFDRDGDLDLYLVNTGALDDRGQPRPDPSVTNRLFRQESDGRFADATNGSGLEDTGCGMGVAVGDVNNDGFPDVYVSNLGPDRLFLNNRDGTFRDVTREAGIDNPAWSTSVAMADLDRDGWLDIYVANYVDFRAGTDCPDNSGHPDYCGPQVFDGQPDKLFMNQGAKNLGGEAGNSDRVKPVARFHDRSVESGIARQGGPGLGVVCADFNGDDWPDVYVANDHAANFMWVNRQDGTFREEAFFRGSALSAQGRPQASMGIACGDIDGNGRVDLLLTHLEGENNALYLGVDDTGFRESSQKAGLAMPSLGFTGFGTQFLDLDNDSDLDLLVVNGRVKRATRDQGESRPDDSVPDFWRVYAERNHAFLNDGDGRFVSWEHASDPFLNRVEVSRGLASGDLDNDGDLDVVISNTAGPARVLLNNASQTSSPSHWLVISATLPEQGGRFALGAEVRVQVGDKTVVRLVQRAASYLSSSDPRVHVGLGTHGSFDGIEVTWPDGRRESFPGGDGDRTLVVEQGQGTEATDVEESR